MNSLLTAGAGSIPAGAGEPANGRVWSDTATVYPRGCGGATLAFDLIAAYPGLSPRVRGSQRELTIPVIALGSIPAGAGEPSNN